MRAYTIVPALAVALSLSGCSGSRDADVIAVALEHFSARSDTMPYHENGITLIEAQTSKWVSGMGESGAKCEVPQKLHDRLVARNDAQQSVAPLLTASKKWRLIRPDDMKGDNLFQFPDKTFSGDSIRTVVRLYMPAFSESGDAALVMFSFRWSIHSAHARYVLMSSGSNWTVQCSDLYFYV
jgi:hypothetical protein